MQLSPKELWSFTFIRTLHRNLDLVRNNVSGQLMVRRVSPADAYPVLCALCDVRHRNLMEIYSVQMQDGVCLSLCEFINGMTLADYVERGGPFAVSEAKRILCQICDGLTALHKSGMVHRDIKPENIMLDSGGRVKIIDYGITRLTKENRSRDTAVLGTAGYASPEQFGFAQTGATADIYACGVLLNFLLTGKLPQEQLYDGALRTVIERCIEIDERKRFQSAADLKRVLQGRRPDTRRPWQPLPGFRSRHVLPKILTVIGIVVWVVLLMASVYSTTYWLPSSPRLFWNNLIISLQFLVFWSALPYLLFGNVFRLAEKINPDNPHNGKFVLYGLGVLSILIGVALIFVVVNIL